MALLQQKTVDRPERGPVLTRAVIETAGRLGLSARELSRVIGVSEPTISRMKNDRYTLEDGSKSFELSALVVRLFRGLDAITGGDEAVARAWIRAENTALAGKPAEKMATVTGLFDVVQYLDARRAPI